MPTSDLLKSFYVAVCCGGFILACTVFVIVARRSSISRAWLPLVPIVNGTLERKYMSAILRGTYQGHPIQATLIVGGAEDADTFRIEMTTDSRATNWSVQYGSEKLFGKDQWYVQTSNDSLQQRLAQSGVQRKCSDGTLILRLAIKRNPVCWSMRKGIGCQARALPSAIGLAPSPRADQSAREYSSACTVSAE